MSNSVGNKPKRFGMKANIILCHQIVGHEHVLTVEIIYTVGFIKVRVDADYSSWAEERFRLSLDDMN